MEKIKMDVAGLVGEASRNALDAKEKFSTQVEKSIDELRQEIQELKDSASAKTAGWDHDFKNKYENAKRLLLEYKEAGSEAYGEVKTGLDNAWSDLKKTVENTKARVAHSFKSNSTH